LIFYTALLHPSFATARANSGFTFSGEFNKHSMEIIMKNIALALIALAALTTNVYAEEKKAEKPAAEATETKTDAKKDEKAAEATKEGKEAAPAAGKAEEAPKH